MIPQVSKRRIGKVNIIDMNGSMTGLWTARLKRQLERAFHHLNGAPTVLNFRHVTDIDTLGLKSLFQVASNKKQFDVLSGDSEIMAFLSRYPESKQFRILNNEEELVRIYGEELVEETKDHDKRGSQRLQTVISVRFSYERDSGKKQCVGIISNVSERGFYIEYIDILSAEASLTELDPHNIQTLDFILSLPNGKTVSGRGTVLHWELNHDQFGIGVQIDHFNAQDEKRFSEFLQSQQNMIIQNQKGR